MKLTNITFDGGDPTAFPPIEKNLIIQITPKNFAFAGGGYINSTISHDSFKLYLNKSGNYLSLKSYSITNQYRQATGIITDGINDYQFEFKQYSDVTKVINNSRTTTESIENTGLIAIPGQTISSNRCWAGDAYGNGYVTWELSIKEIIKPEYLEFICNDPSMGNQNYSYNKECDVKVIFGDDIIYQNYFTGLNKNKIQINFEE